MKPVLFRGVPLLVVLMGAASISCKNSDTITGPPRPTPTARPSATPTLASTAAPGPSPTPAETRTTTPAPTLTPVASAVDISGTWTGSFATNDSADCAPAIVSVRIQITQTGSTFTTLLPGMPCGFRGQLSGQIGSFGGLNGFSATGSVAGNSGTTEFWGTALTDRIRLFIRDLLVPHGNDVEVYRGGTLDLRR